MIIINLTMIPTWYGSDGYKWHTQVFYNNWLQFVTQTSRCPLISTVYVNTLSMYLWVFGVHVSAYPKSFYRINKYFDLTWLISAERHLTIDILWGTIAWLKTHSLQRIKNYVKELCIANYTEKCKIENCYI